VTRPFIVQVSQITENRVDLFAPGVGVRVANFQSNNIPFELDGTSFAAPYVAGVAALYLQTNASANHYAVQNWLKTNATPKMKSYDLKSVNKFLFTNL
jgi:subtilisin family serine protease